MTEVLDYNQTQDVNDFYDEIITNAMMKPLPAGPLTILKDEPKPRSSSKQRFSVVERPGSSTSEIPSAQSDSVARGVFEDFDINGDGCIDIKELNDMFVKVGYAVSKEETESIISNFDADGSNTFGL